MLAAAWKQLLRRVCIHAVKFFRSHLPCSSILVFTVLRHAFNMM